MTAVARELRDTAKQLRYCLSTVPCPQALGNSRACG